MELGSVKQSFRDTWRVMSSALSWVETEHAKALPSHQTRLLLLFSWQVLLLILSTLLSVYLILKYQQLTRRLLRRAIYGDDEPADALLQYPKEIAQPTELELGARSRAESSSGEQVEPPLDHPPHDTAEAEHPAPGGAMRRVESAPAIADAAASTAQGGTPVSNDDQKRIVDVIRFLRLLRHSIQGIDLASALSLFPRIERHDLPKGSALFEEGDPADAMYIVLSGQVGWYRNCDATADWNRGSVGSPVAMPAVGPETTPTVGSETPSAAAVGSQSLLCTLGKGQVIGEYSLFSGLPAARQRRQRLQHAAFTRAESSGGCS